MKLSKFTVILAILLVSILAMGAVSAETVDDSDIVAVTDGDLLESVDITDAADDLSSADTADLAVEDEGGAVLGDTTNSYDLDDDSYSTYFNEDGTATEALSEMGDYTLNVGTLTNKDIKIASGFNINIVAMEGAGFINNGTITIGDGAGSAGSIIVSGLTFTNTNKDAIVVDQYSTKVTIDSNKFDLTYDATYGAENYASPMAIVTYGYVDEVTIVGNEINMESAAGYTYGIDLSHYLANWAGQGEGNAEHFYIADNYINIASTSSFGMVEAFYVDSVANSVIVNNTIVTSSGPGVANYAIAVADSCGYNARGAMYDDEYNNGLSPFNITIRQNNIIIDSGDMAYGITVISWYNYDIDFEEVVKDMVISKNDVTIVSETGAVGIGVQSSDVEIIDNTVTVTTRPDATVAANPDPVFGSESYAIYVDNFKEDLGYYYNTTVKYNVITANVPAIKVNTTEEEDDRVEPLKVENNIIPIDDGRYSLFFYEDGTPTDLLDPEGNYVLELSTLTNKIIKIVSGTNILICGSEGNSLTNTTVIIGDGDGSASSIVVKDLKFKNINKDGIVVNDESKNVALENNVMDLTYDSTYSGSPMAIVIYGHSENITVTDNVIHMESAAGYNYGIDVSIFGPTYAPGSSNAKNLIISGNTINMYTSAARGMGEAIYLDTLTNSVVENNDIYVKTENDVANYGIALADSSNYIGDPITAPYNVTIKNNYVYLDSNDMANGISVISAKSFGGSRDFVIADNNVIVDSAKGAHGIAVYTPDVEISGNTVTVFADPDAENKAYASSYLTNHSATIFINNVDPNSNNTVKNNVIQTSVDKIYYTNEEDESLKPVIQDNALYSVIDDRTFSTYFNEDGTIKDDAPIDEGNVLVLGDLTSKKLVIDTSVTIRGLPNKKLINTTINLVAGADNSVIEDLEFEFTGDETTGSIGIIYIKEVTNVTIQNNRIIVPDFVDKTGARWGSSVYAIEVESGALGSKDIFINNNNIFVEGSNRYLYGIDVFKTGGYENKNKNINIFENYVYLNGGSAMAEGIYVSESDDVIVDGNTIDSTSNGAAYGIGTDQLSNAAFTNNIIDVDAATQSYGITATTSGTDIIIRANEIEAKGAGAVGIGFTKQNGVTIEDNTITVDGGDYTNITVSDSLGKATAAILEGNDNTDVTVNGNKIDEFVGVKLECADLTVTAAPSGKGTFKVTLTAVDGTPLEDREINLFFNNEVLKVTTDENGVAELSFDLNKAGKYPVSIAFLGDKHYNGAFTTATITINPIKTTVTSAAKTYLATASSKTLTATLKDANGNALAKKTVVFTVNGKTYTATTNDKGVATVKLALTAAKTYTVNIKFAGDSVYAASTASAKVKLNKEKTKVTAPKKTFKRTAKTKKVVITLKNSKGKAIAKKKITLTVNKKKYTVKTNKKGKATIKVKLTKKGTFKYTVKFAGDTQYKAAKKNGKIKIK